MDLKSPTSLGLSQIVDGMTSVGAIVFWVGVEDVKSDEAKVIGGPETMALGDWLSIAGPLNLGKWNA